MARGGYRPGAGRKPKGWPGPANELAGNQIATPDAALPAGGRRPLQYLLELMNDGQVDVELRLRAAIAALPFVHPRVQPRVAQSEQPQPKAEPKGKKARRLDAAARPAAGDWAGLLDIPGRAAN